MYHVYTYYFNILLNISMSAYQVNKRHAFLQRLIHVKEEEVTSYGNMNTCVTNFTICVGIFSLMEVIAYFLYLYKV